MCQIGGTPARGLRMHTRCWSGILVGASEGPVLFLLLLNVELLNKGPFIASRVWLLTRFSTDIYIPYPGFHILFTHAVSEKRTTRSDSSFALHPPTMPKASATARSRRGRPPNAAASAPQNA